MEIKVHEPCDYADYHYNLDDCATCPKCGYENHHYKGDPYCEWCGKPNRSWHDAIKQMTGFK